MSRMTERLQDYELRIKGLSDSAKRIGILEERKRLLEALYEEYQAAFATDPVFAEKFYKIIGKVSKDA